MAPSPPPLLLPPTPKTKTVAPTGTTTAVGKVGKEKCPMAFVWFPRAAAAAAPPLLRPPPPPAAASSYDFGPGGWLLRSCRACPCWGGPLACLRLDHATSRTFLYFLPSFEMGKPRKRESTMTGERGRRRRKKGKGKGPAGDEDDGDGPRLPQGFVFPLASLPHLAVGIGRGGFLWPSLPPSHGGAGLLGE